MAEVTQEPAALGPAVLEEPLSASASRFSEALQAGQLGPSR